MAVERFVADETLRQRVETYKGWAFVAATAGLLYLALRKQLASVARETRRREEAEARLHAALTAGDCDSYEYVPDLDLMWRHGPLSEKRRLSFPGIARDYFALVHPDDLNALLEVIRGLGPQSPTYACEYRLRTVGGGYDWIGERAEAQFDETGRLERIVGMDVDVTAVRLMQEARERERRRVRLLADISRRLVVSDTPGGLLHELFSDLAKELEVDVFANYLVAPPGDRLVLESHAGLTPEQYERFKEFRIGEMLSGIVAERRQSIVAPPVPDLPPACLASLAELGLQAYAGHPLMAGERLIGTIAFGSRTRTAFSEEDIGLMRAVADQIAAAVERSRLVSELRASDERWQFALEGSGDGEWDWDMRTNRVHYSRQWKAMLGYADEDVGDRLSDWEELVHPEDKVGLHERLQRHLGGHTAFYFSEHRLRRKDGVYQWVLDRGKVMERAADGRPLIMIGTHTDITERKQLEEALRHQQLLLREAGDIAHVGGWEFDPQTLAGSWTEETARIHDVDPALPVDATQGMHFYRGEANRRITAAIKEAITHGTPYDLELELISAKGRQKWVRTICHPVIEGGRVVRMRGSIQDITERKQLEAQLLRSQRLESVGRLAGGLAHDMNNILSPVMLGVSMLRRVLNDPAALKLLQTIEVSARRGAEINRQLLMFSRGVEGEKTLVPLRALLKDMQNIITETFPKNIGSQVELSPEAPGVVRGDATQLHQVLMNLCVNARDAMPDGGMLTLKLGRQSVDEAFADGTPEARVGDYVMLGVRDTGTGIPPELLDRIFDPFFTTKELGQGTGLGLSTVQGIVKAHGGFIQIDTRFGVGTEFRIYLPESTAATALHPAQPAELAPVAGLGEQILIVDDEAHIRVVLQQVLEQHGYRVIAAESGEGALAAAVRHRRELRLVISDVMMPSMDGVQLARSLQRIGLTVPFIAISGVEQSDKVDELRQLAIAGLLPKPFTAESVLQIVARTLSRDAGAASGGQTGPLPAV